MVPNLLGALYPTDPVVLDDWERKHIYDVELASTLHCAAGANGMAESCQQLIQAGMGGQEDQLPGW